MAELQAPEGVTIPQDIRLSQDIKSLVSEFRNFINTQKDKIIQEPKKVKDLSKKPAIEKESQESLDEKFIEFTDFTKKTLNNIAPSLISAIKPITELENITSIENVTSSSPLTTSEPMTPSDDDTFKNTEKSLKKIANNTNPENSSLGNKIKESLDNGLKEFTEVANKTFDSISPALLGPLRLITDPLQDLTGFSVNDKLSQGFQAITEGLTKKRTAKLNPNKKDVAEAGDEGIGSIYLGEKLDKYFGKDKKDDDGTGLFAGLVGGGIGKLLGGMLLKSLGIGMIIASIALMIKDGILGAMNSEEWGVSKASAIVGAVLGGTREGWKNAFANAGKWALTGAGIGLLAGGPIGALIGGLAGAVIGGLLGYFGGEKIAKFIENTMSGLSTLWDSTKQFFSNTWTKTKDFFINLWNSEFVTKLRTFIEDLLVSVFDFLITPFKKVWEQIMILKDNLANIWGDDDNFLQKLGKTAGEIILFFPKAILAYIMGHVESIKNWFIDVFIGRRETPEGKKNEKALISQFWDILKLFWGAVGNFMINTIQGSIRLFSRGVNFIKDTVFPGIKDFFSGLFTSVIDNVKDFGSIIQDVVLPGIGDFFTNIFTNIRELLFGVNNEGGLINSVKDVVKEFFNDPKEFISNVWTSLTEGITSLVDNILSLFRFIQYKGIGESLKILFTEGMEGFFTQVSDFASNYENLPQEEKKGFFQKIGSEIKGIFNREEKVEDAIIKNNGQIIRTSPNDNLIATKNPIQAIATTSDRLSYTNQEMKSSNILVTLNSILDKITEGNTILNNKDMNPVVVNSGNSGSLSSLTLIGASE